MAIYSSAFKIWEDLDTYCSSFQKYSPPPVGAIVLKLNLCPIKLSSISECVIKCNANITSIVHAAHVKIVTLTHILLK